MFRYKTVRSTQDVALALAQQGVAQGTVVLADAQMAGRGRFGRPWVSLPGASVNLSVVLYPSVERLGRLAIAAAVAVVRAVHALSGLSCAIKWPNDVRINGRKLCGILVESQVPEEGTATAILGIGLNTALDPRQHPEIACQATSLFQETGRHLPVEDATEALLDALDEAYVLLLREDETLFREWREHLETLGRQVEVRWGDEVERGLAEDVDSSGSLVLLRPDGSRVTLVAGEVTLQV